MASPDFGGFMPFKGKIERAMRWNQKKRLEVEGVDLPDDLDDSELPSMEELRAEALEEEVVLEKGDLKAMILAGFVTIFPICAALIGFLALIALLLGGVF